MIKFDVKNRLTGEIRNSRLKLIATTDASYSIKIGLAVKWKIKADIDANLARADLAHADLTRRRPSLTPTSLTPTSLTPHSLAPTSLTPTSLAPTSLTPTSLRHTHSRQLHCATLTRANFTPDANLTDATLTRADFTDANLTRATLAHANLTDANLTRATLTRANIADATLTRADFTDAALTRATLTRADLTDANLTDANLTHADFTDANLTRADLAVFRDDLWAVLSSNPTEVEGLRAAIAEGRIDGSSYNGDCACLSGTLKNCALKSGREFDSSLRNSSRPIERFFLAIRVGDTPEKSQYAKLTLEWVDAWLSKVKGAFAK